MTEHKEISAVVFDFGGVLTTTTMPERVRPLVAELGVPWSALEEGFAKYRKLMDGGYMDYNEMYSKIWADAGVTVDAETQAKILAEDVASYLYGNARTVKWMAALKAAGYGIGILTNMCTEFADKFREHFPECIALADEVVSANTTKPESFGLSIIEAYAMNRPVRAKRFGGAAEVMAAVEAARAPSFREAVLALYGSDRFAARTLAAYRELAGDGREGMAKA